MFAFKLCAFFDAFAFATGTFTSSGLSKLWPFFLSSALIPGIALRRSPYCARLSEIP